MSTSGSLKPPRVVRKASSPTSHKSSISMLNRGSRVSKSTSSHEGTSPGTSRASTQDVRNITNSTEFSPTHSRTSNIDPCSTSSRLHQAFAPTTQREPEGEGSVQPLDTTHQKMSLKYVILPSINVIMASMPPTPVAALQYLTCFLETAKKLKDEEKVKAIQKQVDYIRMYMRQA